MEKAKLHTPDFTEANIAKLAELFPSCVVEAQDEDTGKIRRSIDFDQLRQELSDNIVEGPQERYRLDWPGKRESLLAANAPIAKTLRPDRDESVDFDTTQNLFIEGDNLDALKLLQETYLGKVKMIYIDPPYNTGNDYVYSDKFHADPEEYERESGVRDEDRNKLTDTDHFSKNLAADGRFHSKWVSMIYSRLRLARNLLSESGIIFISIDEGEISNLKKVCDEIFGEENFIEQIAWKNKYGSGALTRGFANVHEYILVYSRSQLANLSAPLDEKQKAAYSGIDSNSDVRGGYVTQPFATNSKDDRPNLRYPIYHEGHEIWPEKQWIWSEERFKKAYDNDEVVINETNGKFSVRIKQYLKDENGVIRRGKPVSFFEGPFNQEGTKEMKSIFPTLVFGFPKPTALLKYLFSFSVNDDQNKDFIVLDFFSGSSSSAHAVLQLNAEDGGKRRFIMVQLPEVCDEMSEAFKAGYKTIAEIGKERIRRAGKKIKEDSGLLADQIDTGFRVLKVDTSNVKQVYYSPNQVNQDELDLHVDHIKEDRNGEDLLFQIMLDWGVDLSLPIVSEKIQGKEVFFVDENAIVACFETGINEDLVKELAKRQPLRAVFRDSGFADDSVKINIGEIFKLLSPATELKTI